MTNTANQLLLPEIREMIATGDDQGLGEVMSELHPASIADFAEGLSVDETWELLGHADVRRQAEVFPFFTPEKEGELVGGIGRERMSKAKLSQRRASMSSLNAVTRGSERGAWIAETSCIWPI